MNRVLTIPAALALAGASLAVNACRQDPVDALAAKGIAPVYNAQTGRLEQLRSDRDGDGKQETTAYMDGATIKYIEIDRNGDGAPDRWEDDVSNLIDHSEEANGSDNKKITRREFFSTGTIRRVVDDVDADGRADKWEHYENGLLARVEMDLVGKGYASQRLTYGASGEVVRIESDPDGDGVFVRVTVEAGGNQQWQ